MNVSPTSVVGVDKIIAHRGWCGDDRASENSIPALLQGLHSCAGVETDLRYSTDRGLYIGHDHHRESSVRPLAFKDLTEAIQNQQGFAPAGDTKYLFLNVKEDGLLQDLAPDIIAKLENSGVKVYFFDMSVPELVRYSKCFPANLAIRISVMEPASWASTLQQHLQISRPVFWIDTFDGMTEALQQDIHRLSSLYPTSEFIIVDPQIHGQAAIDSGFFDNRTNVYLMADV